MKRSLCLTALALSLILQNTACAADSASAEAVVQRQLDAYNARDIDAFLATYSDDVELLNFPATPRSKGKDAMRTRYARLFGDTTLRATVSQRMTLENTVIDREHIKLMSPQGPATLNAVAIYEVKDGKIAKVTFISAPPQLDSGAAIVRP